jgi:hypothetical protein
MGSVRALEMPDPNEYNVSGVLEYGGRGPGEYVGEENMPGFTSGVSCRQYVEPGDLGDDMGII